MPRSTTSPDAAGFVLAGGASSRMGSDKALMQLGGRPLVTYPLESLRRAGLTASIAGSISALDAFAPVIQDSAPGLGPLSGVCSALASTPAQLAIFLAVDAPFIPDSMIRYLLRHAELSGAAITLASMDGFAQTFPAVLDRSVLPDLWDALERGERGCFAAFQQAAAGTRRALAIIPVEELMQSGQLEPVDGRAVPLWFQNINTSEDLRRAESFLAAHRIS